MPRRPHALIIGGSVGGLFAAGLLRAVGWRTTVFERSSGDLAGRGAGIGITQELLDVMTRIGTPIDLSIGMPVKSFVWLGGDGRTRYEHPRPMAASAWARIYRPLRAAFPDAHYRDGMTLERVEQDADSVTTIFRDGSRSRGDLLVGADGSISTVRHQYLPEVAPRYAGYVAWRGIIDAHDVPPATVETVAGRIVFSFHEREMMLAMPVPGAGDDMRSGRRRIYFIWYRPTASRADLEDLFTDASGRYHGVSIPPPLIRPELVREIRSIAAETFAAPVAALVERTPQPLLQAVSDLEAPRLVFGRVALLGDAAFVARPHVAGGITKAALDAGCLADALATANGDIGLALARYDAARREFGSRLVAHARLLGMRIEREAGPPGGRRGDARFFDPAWIMRQYGAPHLLHDADLNRPDRGGGVIAAR